MADKTRKTTGLLANSRKRRKPKSKQKNTNDCMGTKKRSRYFLSYAKTKNQKFEPVAITSHKYTCHPLPNITRLGRKFYNKPTEELAKNLLGKLLYRILDGGEVLCGKIVETEAYLGEIDKACHSYGGKVTERTKPMFMAPGTAYVYIIYGMYHCFNISSGDRGACVLIRALEPIKGMGNLRVFALVLLLYVFLYTYSKVPIQREGGGGGKEKKYKNKK